RISRQLRACSAVVWSKVRTSAPKPDGVCFPSSVGRLPPVRQRRTGPQLPSQNYCLPTETKACLVNRFRAPRSARGSCPGRHNRGGRMADDASYERLLSPLQIRAVTLPNRVITTGHSIAAPWAPVRDDADNYVEYARRRAAGGVALLITQPVVV